MPTPATPILPDESAPAATLLQTLVAMAPMGIMLLRPVYAEATGIVDFAIAQLNPAARQMLGGLPEHPTESLQAILPAEHRAGGLAFCRQAFLSGQVERTQQLHQGKDVDGYYQVVAQRHDEQLLVTFTDTNEQPRSAVEIALRASQAREQEARAEAERQSLALQRSNEELEKRVREGTAQVQEQQRLLRHILESVPAAIATLSGPEHRFSFANAHYQYLVGNRVRVGQAVAEALPEVVEQGIIELLDRVYETGEPFIGRNVMIMLEQPPGPPHQYYYDLTYLPLRDGQGQVQDLLVFAVEVTEQVRVRRQTTLLQTELLAGAQRQVQQREELYEVFEQAPAAIVLLREPDHRIEYVNPAYQQLFPGVALRGRRLAEAQPDLVASGTLARINQVFQTGTPYIGEEQPLELPLLPGQPAQTRYFNFVYHPYREEGRIVGISVFAYDVTEQVLARRQIEQLNAELEARVAERTQEARAAQAAAERERAQLQALLTQAPVAIALFKGEQVRIASANEQMAALWGRTPEQVLGRPLLEAVPELQGQGFDELIRGVLATRVPYVGTEAPATILRDGKLGVRYYDFSCQPIYGAQGELLGVLNVGVEVTEQVEARRSLEQLNQELETRVQQRTRELSEQQALLGQILGQVPAFIATLSGPEHRFTFFNESYQALVAGRARLGGTVAELLPEVIEQGFVGLLDRVYATAEPFVGNSTPAQLYDAQTGQNEQRYLDFVYQPLLDARQQVQGILAFIVDVTDQVRARQQVLALNEQLTRTNEQLTHTNADLDTFVYAASHDLKAPIANIEGLLGALREYLPTEAQEPMVPRLVGMMEKAITRFQQTVGHLTDIARLQNELPQAAEQVDLAAVFEGVRLDLLPLLESTHAELVLDLADCPAVHFSPKHLRSVLFNLLSNAVKYRAPDRTPLVQVRTHCTTTTLVLEVQDNGLGLSAEQQTKLFAMFRRLHTHVEGSGVGLYLIKRTLENAGGTITVQSEPGVGSTFTVTIPRA